MYVYYKAKTEFLGGNGMIFTEFHGEIAVRQISVLNGLYFSSSSILDWNEKIGFLLYDGLKSELDLSQSLQIQNSEFEAIWLKSFKDERLEPKYLVGDGTIPSDSKILIAHIVNNKGVMGKGFALALKKRWPSVKEKYLSWVKGNDSCNFALGEVQFLIIENGRFHIANMLAQDGIKRSKNDPNQYVDLDFLRDCLRKVRIYCLENRLSVQMPKIGSGLGGGNWKDILEIIENELLYYKIKVIVMTLD